MKVLNNLFTIYKNDYISNGSKQQRIQFKNTYDTVSFTSVRSVSSSAYGHLGEATQKQIENITDCLTYIQNYFSIFKTNPVKASKVKKGFPKLVQTKTKSLTFKTGDKSSITILRGKKNPNILRISVQEGKITEHFLIDGNDKVISNVNKKSPSVLPQRIRYMMSNEIANSQIQHYISVAEEYIGNYVEYLRKIDCQPQKSVVKEVKHTNIKSISNAGYNAYDTVKNSVKEVLDLFSRKQDELPSHIIPQIDKKTGKVIGLSVKTSDGGELKFSKRLNPTYKESLTYLAFEKTNQDGSQSFMSIDLNTYKFLKMKEKGKPLVTNHAVHEYNSEEVQRRNFVEKLEEYVKEIKGSKQETSNVQPVKQITSKESVSGMPDTEKDLQIMMELAKTKGEEHAKIFQDVYFETLLNEVTKGLEEKFKMFDDGVKELINRILSH